MHGIVTARERAIVGIGLSFLSFAILSGADALTKLLSARYSIFELAAIDAVFALMIVTPIVVRADGFAGLVPRRLVLVALRCVLGAGSLITAFLAFARIPLADAYSLAFVSPLAVAALSAPVLGEHVGWRQWTAVAIGFAAVIVILRPSFASVGMGQFWILVSALLFAVSLLILRRIADSESQAALVTVYLVMVLLLGLPLAIVEWRPPSLADLGLMLVMGACSGLGNLILIHASRAAPASIVSSFMYTQLVWGTALGAALFGDLPDLITILGAAVIIGCGLYTLWHHTDSARAAAEG